MKEQLLQLFVQDSIELKFYTMVLENWRRESTLDSNYSFKSGEMATVMQRQLHLLKKSRTKVWAGISRNYLKSVTVF